MNRCRVSVITPVYNDTNWLDTALDSLRRQSFDCWECIIIDDGSDDPNREAAELHARRDSRFRLSTQLHAGLSAARNTGLDMVGGEYIQFLDADDLLEPEKISEQVEFLDQNPNVDAVVSDHRYVDEAGQDVCDIESDRILSIGFESGRVLKISDYIYCNTLPVNSYLIRKSSWVQYFDNGLTSYEDWDFWIRGLVKGKKIIFMISESGAGKSVVRCRRGSMTAEKRKMIYNLCRVRIKMLFTAVGFRQYLMNLCLLFKDVARLMKESMLSGHKKQK